MKLLFLGTGTSVGVPQIGCKCPTCTSADPRDKRRRSGLYVSSSTTGILVDTSPELRLACIELDIAKVDAVLLTHCHMDHVAGFDDVRRFNTLNSEELDAKGHPVGKVLDCYAAAETLESLHHIFPYISNRANTQGLYRPMINFVSVAAPFMVGDILVTPLPVEHGGIFTYGYRFDCDGKSAAYVSDCISIPDATLELMKGCDLAVLDCLRERFHPTHMNRERFLAAMEKISPKLGLGTHMCHSVKHAEFEATLPDNIRLAYDGMTVEL